MSFYKHLKTAIQSWQRQIAVYLTENDSVNDTLPNGHIKMRYSQCDLILHHQQNRSEYIMHIHHPAPQKHWTNYKMFVKGRPSKTQRFENANRPFALQVPEKFQKLFKKQAKMFSVRERHRVPWHPRPPYILRFQQYLCWMSSFISSEWNEKERWSEDECRLYISCQTERDGYWTSHPPGGLYDKRNESFTQHQAGEADIYSTLMKWHISTISL